MNRLSKIQQTALTCFALTGALTACGAGDSGTQNTGGTTGFGGQIVGQGGQVVGQGGQIVGQGGTVVGQGGQVVGQGGQVVGQGGQVVGQGGSTGGTGAGGATTGDCNPTGTWAIQFKTNVSWAATLVLTAGQGSQVLKMLAQRTYDPNTKTMTDDARICSVALPDFQALTGPIHVEFPPAAFDTAPVKTLLTSTLANPPAPGNTFTSPPSAVIIGATLQDPVNGAWPNYDQASAFTDPDTDGKPGVTANATGAPVTVLGPNAEKMYISFRSVASVTGVTDTCDHGTGDIALTSIKQSIVGCTIPGADCNADHVKFLNDNAPVWTPGTGSKITVQRIAAGASCADVRGMTFN